MKSATNRSNGFKAIWSITYSCDARARVCVCALVTFMSPSKMAEPIEMPFGGWLTWAQGSTR